jgi:signal transduction histidine kinase
VRFSQTGSPATLATGQQLAIYRIVQEALTNALRHGDNAREAVVNFEWAEDTAEITVSSEKFRGEATTDGGSGHGVPGMRERAALVGGRLSIEETDKRYVVTAAIPIAVRTGTR